MMWAVAGVKRCGTHPVVIALATGSVGFLVVSQVGLIWKLCVRLAPCGRLRTSLGIGLGGSLIDTAMATVSNPLAAVSFGDSPHRRADRMCALVDVLIGGRPSGDADPHGWPAFPQDRAAPACPLLLNGADQRIRLQQQRVTATRCCWPPDSSDGG
ncbi:MAG: hypothetical protein ACYCPF_01475 [Streptosporangiaceae bacterium]